jgi:hypothetical protein
LTANLPLRRQEVAEGRWFDGKNLDSTIHYPPRFFSKIANDFIIYSLLYFYREASEFFLMRTR